MPEVLKSWSPASVMLIILCLLVSGITGWYGYHMMAPPEWIQTLLIAASGGGLYSLGHVQGTSTVAKAASVANGVMQRKGVTNEPPASSSGGGSHG